MSQVAKKLGFKGFDFNSAVDIFNEHAALSAQDNANINTREQTDTFRYFNLKGLMRLSTAEYDALQPVQWPVWSKTRMLKLFNNCLARGQFSHKNTKAKLIPTVAINPVHAISEDYPLILNTGRIRDQWHTMTRTGFVAKFNQSSC